MTRDPLEAIEKIERALVTSGRPVTISKLAKRSGLHYNTVKRYVNLLDSVRRMPAISVIRGEGAVLVTLETERDLTKLPENEQIKIIKSFFPRLDREGKFLIDMMERDAIKETVAIKLKKTPFVRKMVKIGRISETEDGKFYLTELGYKIAKGAKKIYTV